MHLLNWITFALNFIDSVQSVLQTGGLLLSVKYFWQQTLSSTMTITQRLGIKIFYIHTFVTNYNNNNLISSKVYNLLFLFIFDFCLSVLWFWFHYHTNDLSYSELSIGKSRTHSRKFSFFFLNSNAKIKCIPDQDLTRYRYLYYI